MDDENFSELPEFITWNNEKYIKRIMTLNQYVLIEYSKVSLLGRYEKPELYTREQVKENLLVDARSHNVNSAVEIMNKKIQKYFK